MIKLDNFSSFFVANWKLNGNLQFIDQFIAETSFPTDKSKCVVICPTSIHLNYIPKNKNEFYVGAQNVSQHNNGAFTGEISAYMLKDIGCKYVLIGHSERRVLMKESNDIISEKFNTAIAHDLIPILCVGETINEREQGLTKAVIQNQIDIATQGYDFKKKACFVIAYEPIWAIGTGLTATPNDAQDIHSHIRSRLKIISKELAENTQILYGGSVNKDNAEALFSMPDIDGGLIGGASLDSSGFMAIARQKNK